MYVYSQDRQFIEELHECSIHSTDSKTECSILINGTIRGRYSSFDRCCSILTDIARTIAACRAIYILPADAEREEQQ